MKAPNWYLKELPLAGQEHLDEDYVSHYDQKAATDPHEDLAILIDMGLDKTHTLIDFGAGSGTFAIAAAKICKRVIASDISRPMVELLQAKIEQQSIQNIECFHSSILTYQHQKDSVDFIYTRHVLHHLPDFWKAFALQRMADNLKSGGVLFLRDLVYSCNLDEIEAVLESWFNNAPKHQKDGWTRTELETHVREEHSTFSWLLEEMINQAGFEIRDIQHSTTRVHSAYVCVKK